MKKQHLLFWPVVLVLMCLVGSAVWASGIMESRKGPVIRQQPVSVTAQAGEKATVTLAAEGEGLTYQWYYRNADSAQFLRTNSFKGNSYSVTMNASRSNRQIYCVVTDRSGASVRSNTVTLYMGTPLTIEQLPVSVEVAEGEKAVVTVGATGDGLSYHWFYKDAGSPVFRRTGTFTGNTYSVTMNEARSDRQIFCVVGDSHGNAIRTNTVTLSMSDPVPQPPQDGIYDVGYDELPYTDEQIYAQLFDLNNKVQVDIDMPPAELQKLHDDYTRYKDMGSKSPIYRMGTLMITITTGEGSTTYRIEEVGVRMKGNTSRTSFYDSQNGIYNHIHYKLDFQETFDDEEYYGTDAKVWDSKDQRKVRKNRTFALMEKLELRWNKCGDSTYLKESYSYELYRSEGVLAPMVSLCSLDWSGVHMGVYTINEPVDELFLEKRLPEAELGGDLYKCGWTNEGCTFTSTNSIGIEDEDKGEFYCFDLKTNKKTSDHSTLKNFIHELNSGSLTKERFAEMVDVDQFLRYAAVSYFLGNPDDLRNNYNNCYIYFTKTSGKLIVIPYDMDRCLGIVHEFNPTGNGVTRDDPFSADTAAAGGQRNPLYLYSVVKGGWYVSDFAQVLEEVSANDLLKADTFESQFRQVSAVYGSDAQPSRTLHNSGGRSYAFELDSGFGGNLSFRRYIDAKMETFRSAMEDIQGSSECYVRGSFNNWSIENDYRMTRSGSVLTYTLRMNSGFEFKIYDAATESWYGTEIISQETTVSYGSSDGHANVILSAGTYRLTYDPVANSLTISYV